MYPLNDSVYMLIDRNLVVGIRSDFTVTEVSPIFPGVQQETLGSIPADETSSFAPGFDFFGCLTVAFFSASEKVVFDTVA